MTTLMEPTTKPSSPRIKQKSLSKNKPNCQKEYSNAEITVAPVKITAEEISCEQSLICHESATQQQLKECAEFLNKIKSLQFALELDLLSCDAKWTLFVSAAFSYRYGSMLQPFPPQFASELLGYDIDSLLATIKDVPKLCIVLQILMEEAYHELSGEVIKLLYWVLIEKAEPTLRLVEEEEELNNILNSVDDKPFKSKPTHLFKVNASKGFHCEIAFKDRVQNLPLKLAFMGNKLDTYYSILQNGFSHLKENKTDLKLSTDLHTSLLQSPFSAAWGASQCGSIISCAAICEFAVNAKEDELVANENDDSCVDIYLCRPENIRLRYLIFYGRRLPKTLVSRSRFFSWIYKGFSFSLLSYMLLFATIGIASSEKGGTVKHYLVNKFEIFLSFCRRFVKERISNQ